MPYIECLFAHKLYFPISSRNSVGWVLSFPVIEEELGTQKFIVTWNHTHSKCGVCVFWIQVPWPYLTLNQAGMFQALSWETWNWILVPALSLAFSVILGKSLFSGSLFLGLLSCYFTRSLSFSFYLSMERGLYQKGWSSCLTLLLLVTPSFISQFYFLLLSFSLCHFVMSLFHVNLSTFQHFIISFSEMIIFFSLPFIVCFAYLGRT